VAGGTQLCFGRGERLEPLPAAAEASEGFGIVLVKDPGVSVSTPWAYGECRRQRGATYQDGEAAFEQRRSALRQAPWLASAQVATPPPLRNDLQDVVAPQTPAVQTALKLLQALPGQLRVAMSGSGPSCFALFPGRPQADRALEQGMQQFQAAGLEAWSCSFLGHGAKLLA
jgi:4-diphosphocytidyl-2-C-methyl-D-erythritol kinase